VESKNEIYWQKAGFIKVTVYLALKRFRRRKIRLTKTVINKEHK
jgi:hypothetical protein